MSLIAINGIQIPTPQSIDFLYRTMGKSDTNADGETVLDRVAVKRDMKCVWRYLPEQSSADLLSLLLSEPFFMLSFIDPATSEETTGEYMAMDPIFKVSRYDQGKAVGYKDIQITFKER